ncbi:hypothetical protein [Haloferax sp. Atlit-6N]|uniref:hypothetical protein n=1 Tax=Haloferax sp. Atlit-6N TaxID=2077205 RepID=UPI001F1E7129|nr:hypothetical protein [Haloferax sp. Atlit-6N]
MNGDAVRFESDHFKATAGCGARKQNLQLVFFDAQYPEPERTADGLQSVESQTMSALERVEAAVERSGLELDDVLGSRSTRRTSTESMPSSRHTTPISTPDGRR